MKKNILIVQSLVLPLLTSASLLCMEKETPQTQEESVSSEQFIKELLGQRLFRIQQERLNIPTPHTSSINIAETATENSELVKSEIEVINVALPVEKPLLSEWASVILPTQEKELSWKETLNYYTSTSYQHLQKMISYLQDGKFDITDKRHFGWLDQAVVTATVNQDIKSLLTISDLCQNKYATTIRVSEEVAQPASELLNAHYRSELSLANKTLQSKHQEQMKQWNTTTATCMKSITDLVNTYNQNIKMISDSYNSHEQEQMERMQELQKSMLAFSALQKSIRAETTDLVKTNQVKAPKHIFASTIQESEKRLNSLKQIIETIPTIKELQPIKHLENK